MKHKMSASDCEDINSALGLEVNASISSIRVHKLITLRLAQLSARELKLLPANFWSTLSSCFGDSFDSTNPATPEKGKENSVNWFDVVHVSGGKFEIHVSTKLDRARLMDSLRKKPKFREWSKIHKPHISYSSANLSMLWIDCKAFDGVSAEFVKTVLSRM